MNFLSVESLVDGGRESWLEMSWLEGIDDPGAFSRLPRTAVFGVSTEVGVQYMKVSEVVSSDFAVVDVDAARFLALWRAHPESGSHDVATGTPTSWPADSKWKNAVDAFQPGRANPVPLALVWIAAAWERAPSPWWEIWPSGRTKVRDLHRIGAGITDGVTRTIWLLTYGASSFPVLIKATNAEILCRMAGVEGRQPVTPNAFFSANPGLHDWSRRST